MKKEFKFVGGQITGTKQEDRNGVPVGIVEGYIATWDIDRGDFFGLKDRFVKGAFVESILEHIQRLRDIRLKDHHSRTIGTFPIRSVKEDERGLFGIGEINLDVQQGREAFSLAKQGALSDFSIGFSVDESEMDGDIRTITKATIWEGSIVDEPMNPNANITQVKSVVPFQDLPLAPQDRPWDSSAAIARVREFTDSEDAPSSAYRRAFVWFDNENSDSFGAYKLPIADVIDGRLTAVPRGIFAAAAALQGARGGVDIPDADRPRVISHIESYYDKMDLDSPFDAEEASRHNDIEEGDKQFYGIDDVKEWTERDIEKALRGGAKFSKSAAKLLMGIMGKEMDENGNDGEKYGKILDELRGIKGLVGAG